MIKDIILLLTNQQNYLRLNEVVMNVAPYMDNNAKYNRNRIGNAIFKHYRKEYEYKKCYLKENIRLTVRHIK